MNTVESVSVFASPGSACPELTNEAIFVAFYEEHADTLLHRLIAGFWVYDDQHQRRYRHGVNSALAEEICQQVWLEMWKGLIAGKSLSLFTIYRRADARLTDHFRRLRRLRQLDEAQAHADSRISHDDRIDIDRAITRLAPKDRQIVKSWLYGNTAQEIAAEHGVHPNTVTNILKRITKMKDENLNITKTSTVQRVLSALPGTPAEVAKKAGITREAAKKQLQRLQKVGKVVSIDGIYSPAIVPTDNSALVSRLQEFAQRLVSHKVKVSVERFDDEATDENDIPTREVPELPTRDARQSRGAA